MYCMIHDKLLCLEPIMLSPSPLINPEYIKQTSTHDGVSNPFYFPLDFDTSGQLYIADEMKVVCKFLFFDSGNNQTLLSSTKELEKLVQWMWRIKNKSLAGATREDGLEYISFIKSPSSNWIGSKPYKKYLPDGLPNPQWRPFLNRRSGNYEISESALQKSITVVDRFYRYMHDEGLTQINPFTGIRKKISLIRTTQEVSEVRRITNFQWDYVIRSANELADSDGKYERHLFVLIMLKTHFLRVSDLVPYDQSVPRMNDFQRMPAGWVLVVIGKGNKKRVVPMKDVGMEALKRYRLFLGLSPYPLPNDDTYLLPSSNRVKKPFISTTREIQRIVEFVFKHAVNKMLEDGLHEETVELQSASSHWLRHTGISEDVKERNLNDVRQDAGHSSIHTTSRYIDSTLQDRIESAKNQPL